MIDAQLCEYTRKKETVHKGSYIYKILEKSQQIYTDRIQIVSCLGRGDRQGIQRGIRQVWGVINTFNVLIVVMFSQMYTYVKYCQTVYLKHTQFIVYQLFFNKTLKNT